LRPAQLKVLAGLLRGDSAKAIAEELGRSQYTIINHTRTIFAAFRVHNRADVRRACARAGITPTTLEAVL
jgi:DNA-binding NarL/FixJ family response regulator